MFAIKTFFVYIYNLIQNIKITHYEKNLHFSCISGFRV